MKENFYRVLLESNEKEVVKSYMEAFELDDKFVRLVMQSKYSGEFMEFLQNLRNQQAKPVDVDATAPSPEKEISAPVEVETITDGAEATFDKFLFQKIDVEELFCEEMSSTVKNALRKMENALFEKGIIYWGQIYTENQKVVKVLPSQGYRIFSANVERCFGRKVYDIAYIKSVLAPMLSDFTHKKEEAEKKVRAENERKERAIKVKTPISKLFARGTKLYSAFNSADKKRVTRILGKIGEWSLSELKSFSPEDINAELKSEKLADAFQRCIMVEA
jgi:hypothetical protein